MTAYIGVWEGPAPISNAHAGSEFQRLLAERGQAPPTVKMEEFIDALLRIHPDVDRPEGEDGPWADAPLVHCADGGVVYLPVRPGRIDEVRPLVEELATSLELVAYDSTRNELIPSATSVARSGEFELPAPAELPVHLRAVMNEALTAGRPLAGVLEQVSTDFYVQWLVKAGTLTIEAQGDRLLPESLKLPPAGQAQMADLGFIEGDPNWRIRWADGDGHLDEAAVMLGRVLTEVRGLPVGEMMRLETFPV